MFVNNYPAKEGEEEYAIIKISAKNGQMKSEFTLSHTPDLTTGVSFVQAAAYTAFQAIKDFADENAKQQGSEQTQQG